MSSDIGTTMAKTRALMTDTERERIAGLTDVEDIKVYQAKSRIRRRIEEELTFDLELLEEHAPDLHEELVDVVCPDPAPAETDTAAAVEPEAEPHTATPPVTDEEDEDLLARAEAVLDELDVPGRPRAVERTRRKAIMYAWDRLREEGKMETWRLAADTLGQYWDDPDLNYTTSGAAHRGPGYQLWDNCVRDALRELPGVHDGDPWEFRESEIDE
jgi:hypothetical protein